MDIFKAFDGILRNLDSIADAKGVIRAGALWETAQIAANLKSEVQKQLDGKDAKIEELKAQLEIIQKGVE
jgi:hypothetical protein